jgi:hypothetical protein
MTDDPKPWICDRCGRQMIDPTEIGYLGPSQDGHPVENTSCSPFMTFLTLCESCYELERLDDREDQDAS